MLATEDNHNPLSEVWRRGTPINFTCTVSPISTVSSYTATNIRALSVGTHGVWMTTVCFRTCTFIYICSEKGIRVKGTNLILLDFIVRATLAWQWESRPCKIPWKRKHINYKMFFYHLRKMQLMRVHLYLLCTKKPTASLRSKVCKQLISKSFWANKLKRY